MSKLKTLDASFSVKKSSPKRFKPIKSLSGPKELGWTLDDSILDILYLNPDIEKVFLSYTKTLKRFKLFETKLNFTYNMTIPRVETFEFYKFEKLLNKCRLGYTR